MVGATNEVHPAQAGEHAAVVDDLLEAFMDDPVLCWAMPDPRRRRRHGRAFFTMQARRSIDAGHAWAVDGGAALWHAPGRWRESLADLARLAVPGTRGTRASLPRVLRGLLAIESRHPREPHAYLSTIGVVPDRRADGLGAQLLAPGLAWADAAGHDCYLESSNPRNVGFYERHGFAAREPFTLPRGPVMTPMWRPAR